MKKYLLIATAFVALASCSDDTFVGENNSPNANEDYGGAIEFGGGFKAVTRGGTYGAAAADMLGNIFIVLGVKGDGTGIDQTTVFQNYTVEWTANSAGKTESNTADWEYVGKGNNFGLAGAQAIKYWDYSATAYDFVAYSVGKNTLITSGAPGENEILATGITYAYTDDSNTSNPVPTTTSFSTTGTQPISLSIISLAASSTTSFSLTVRTFFVMHFPQVNLESR